MILPLRKTSLHIHPLFPALVIFCLLTGRTGVLISILCLLLHECGHLLLLILFRRTPAQISLTPFGGMMELPEEGLPPLQAFLIAMAGPLFSLLGCCLALAGLRFQFLPIGFSANFFRTNLLLALFNLLPVLPLDGGRMVQALLSPLLPRQRVKSVLILLADLVSLALMGLSIRSAMVGQLDFSPAFAGAYLLYVAGMESKRSPLRYYSSLVARPASHRLTYPVQQLAVPETTPLYTLAPRMRENCYHLLHIIGRDSQEPLGFLSDHQLCQMLMENGQMTAGEALQAAKKRSAV